MGSKILSRGVKVAIVTLAVLASVIDQTLSGSQFELIRNEEPDFEDYNWDAEELDGDGRCSNDYSVDYILLALTWAPGFCSAQFSKCREPTYTIKSRFTIHGLWAQKKPIWGVNDCCNPTPFDRYALRGEDQFFNQNWISIKDTNNFGFMSYEYKKHGSCFRDVKRLADIRDYFAAAKQLYEKYNVPQALAASGVYPSNDGYYPSIYIIEAIRMKFGARPMVKCRQQFLAEVDLCFDLDLNIIDCPAKNSCPVHTSFVRNVVKNR